MAPKHILIPKSTHRQISVSPWCPAGGTATKLKHLLQFIKMYSFYRVTEIAIKNTKTAFGEYIQKLQNFTHDTLSPVVISVRTL